MDARETMSRQEASTLGLRLALAVTWLTAGANFLGFKIAVDAFPPFLMTALRLGAAGAILLVILLASARHVARPNPSMLRDAWLSGLLFLMLGQGLIVAGVQYTTAGHAALLAATAPLMTALVAWPVRRRLPTRRGVCGLVLGFAGLAVLIGPAVQDRGEIAGSLLILTGTLAWGVAMVHAETAIRPANAALSAALQMLPASLMLVVLSLAIGEFDGFTFGAVTWQAWAALAYLVLIGSILGYSTFVWMLPKVAPATANSFFYVGPVITLGLGWLLLGEAVRTWDLVGAVVTLAGVALMVSLPKREA